MTQLVELIVAHLNKLPWLHVVVLRYLLHNPFSFRTHVQQIFFLRYEVFLVTFKFEHLFTISLLVLDVLEGVVDLDVNVLVVGVHF